MDAREPCELLVTGDHVLPMTDGLSEIESGAVAIAGGAIVAVGPAADLTARFEPADTLDGGIVMPGLVNTHGHAGMTLYRGLGDDMPLEKWLHEFVWPAEKEFTTPENVAIGTRLAVAEMIASGTTTFADMYFYQSEVAEVCRAAGMRVLLGQAVIGFPTPDCPDTGTSFQRAQDLVDRYGDDPLVRVSMALHAVYTLSREQLTAGAEHAARMGIPLQIHMSETATEVANCVETNGVRPPQLLADTGVLREGTICAHGVHLNADEMALIRDHGAGIALNPESNLKLASGVPDIAALVAAGVRLGLGTDGAASNNDLDMWDAVRLAALLPKGMTQDPTIVPAAEAVAMATRGGADLLGLADTAGTLEPGKRADLCVIDTSAPHLTPLYNPTSLLAYAVHGSDVMHTVIEGRIVYRDRKHTTVDVTQTRHEATELAARICAA